MSLLSHPPGSLAFEGMPVILDDGMTVSDPNKPKPRSKRRRIRNKWAKRWAHLRVPNPMVYRLEDRLVMHPAIFERLKLVIATESPQARAG